VSIYGPILAWFREGNQCELSDLLDAETYGKRLHAVPGLAEVARNHLTVEPGESTAAAMELVLEGLHQASLLSKQQKVGAAAYTDMLDDMMKSLGE
ncbi:MAG: magnesium chelatase, partial [Planctomycetota bacterium]|jgi:hypothetical protein